MSVPVGGTVPAAVPKLKLTLVSGHPRSLGHRDDGARVPRDQLPLSLRQRKQSGIVEKLRD